MNHGKKGASSAGTQNIFIGVARQGQRKPGVRCTANAPSRLARNIRHVAGAGQAQLVRPRPDAMVAAAAIFDLDALAVGDDLDERRGERQRRARPVLRPPEDPVLLDEADRVLNADAELVHVLVAQALVVGLAALLRREAHVAPDVRLVAQDDVVRAVVFEVEDARVPDAPAVKPATAS